MRTIRIAALAGLMMGAAPAIAKDDVACGKDLICASVPLTVAASLMRAGYQAELTKDGGGDPMIRSAASGYKFNIYFYGCEKNEACDSIQFWASFDGDGSRDETFANGWNASKRFMQMSIGTDGSINVTHDVATIGGLTAKNFADECDWWATMLGTLSKYFDAHPIPAAKPAAPTVKPAVEKN